MYTSSQLLCEHGKLSINWEDTPIQITFDFEDDKHKIFYKAIMDLQKEIEILKEKSQATHSLKNIDNKFAKLMILGQISSKKREGKKKISIIELHQELDLPLEQIDTLMKELERENLVRELENE